MRRHIVPALLAAAALGGCSSGSGGLSTASILGTAPSPPAADSAVTPVAAPLPVPSTPTERAFQVGTVSARAAKCGYNFDAPKLKANYLAHEVGLGASNEQLATVEKVYNVAYNGVTKAAAEDPNYCSDRKTPAIKADLGRLLAGDFEPPKKVVAKKEESGGIFGDFFSSSGDTGPSFGSDDWWQKQQDKAGG